MTCPERPAERRERLEAGAPRIRDPQMPELAGRRALGVLGRSLGIRQRPPRSLEERASGVGEPHLAGRADEEIDPEVALELPDRGAEGRLRHVHPLRGAAEVQLLRHGDEVAQVAQLDHVRRSVTLPIPARSRVRPDACWPRATPFLACGAWLRSCTPTAPARPGCSSTPTWSRAPRAWSRSTRRCCCRTAARFGRASRRSGSRFWACSSRTRTPITTTRSPSCSRARTCR